MSDEREYLLRQAMTILHGARAACDAAVVLIGAAQSDSAEPDEEHDPGDTDRDPTPVEEVLAEYPSFGGGGFTPDAGSMDARTRMHARRMMDRVNIEPLTKDIIRADAPARRSAAADATGAADSHLSTE